MKKFTMMAAMVAALAGCGPKEEALKMITEAAFPPYEFMRGQEIVGVDVEICKAIARKLGRPFQAETINFEFVISSVISGKADLAVAGITITDDRKENVDFSIPYVKTGIVVIYRKANQFTGVEQLKGRKIGVQEATTSETFVLEQLGQMPERFRSPAAAVAGLKTGSVEFVIADIGPARSCVKGDDELAISDFITGEEYAIAIKKGQPELLAVINMTIEELKQNGMIEKWIDEYTKESAALTDK